MIDTESDFVVLGIMTKRSSEHIQRIVQCIEPGHRFFEQKAEGFETKHQIYVWMSHSLPYLLTRVEDPHRFVLKLLLQLPRVPKQKLLMRVDMSFLLTHSLLRAKAQVESCLEFVYICVTRILVGERSPC